MRDYQVLGILRNIQAIDTIMLPPSSPKISKIFLKEKYVQEGLSTSEIAKLVFSSRPTICRYLRLYGIPQKQVSRSINGGHVYGFKRYGGRAVEKKKEQEVLALISSYRASGYSYQRIADFLNDQRIETKMKKGFWYSKVVRQIHLRVVPGYNVQVPQIKI